MEAIKRLVHLSAGRAQLEELSDGVTLDDLQRQLESSPAEVVHYIGHGEFDAKIGAQIFLNRKSGASDPIMVSAEDFAARFRGAGVRLAVLNCCYGSATGEDLEERSLSGLAPSLLSVGV